MEGEQEAWREGRRELGKQEGIEEGQEERELGRMDRKETGERSNRGKELRKQGEEDGGKGV